MPSSLTLRRALVAELEKAGCIRTPAVRRAFLTVPRERFVPEIAARDGLERVYGNNALITHNDRRGTPTSSSSQPSIMAEMLERLDLKPGLRVLEIGTGTGYNAALLATIVGPRRGAVTSIEVQADVANTATAALDAAGYPVSVVVGDAMQAGLVEGPFDRIVLTASAERVETWWRDCLVDGGLLELPLWLPGPAEGEQAVVTLRREGERLRSVAIVPGAFMVLRDANGRGRDFGADQISFSETVAGKHRSFAYLASGGLARMSPAARRRLAALVMTEPRPGRRVVTPGLPVQSLLPYLQTSPPPAGTVTVRGFSGVGLAGRDGRSLAIAVRGRRSCRLTAWGASATAPDALEEAVAGWQRRGRPTLDDCVVEVTAGGDGHDRGVSLSWPG